MRSRAGFPRFVLLFAMMLLVRDAAADRFRDDGRYDSAIPTPAAVLGFELGERPARYDEVVRYAEALAAASPRVNLDRYARSHEGRDLMLLVISSEANLGRLEAIRAEIAALADARAPMSSATLNSRVKSTPAIAYMAYGIHGDELSSTDAAIRLAYELAAGETDDVRQMRDRLVVLIDPTENPDGRERILAMGTSYKGQVANPDPDALSHSGMWPWGRGNHYLFDLNRDWFALVHPESRGRADVLRTWHPQLVVDSHEMGFESTYLFNPPRDPFNPHLPGSTQSWWARFNADQARAFDRKGWSYYTREWADEFYPGYGSSLALYMGAVGILYEQAGTDGQPVRKPSGRIENFAEGVEHHFVSSMANLGTAATHRDELLKSYRAARAEAVDRGRRGRVRAYYITPRPDPGRAQRLAHRLARIGIEVERLESAGRLGAARSPWDGAARSVSLPAGSYRVRLDQPGGLLASAVLEPHTPLPDSTLKRERESLERQRGTRLYDVTGWSPLLGSGLETYWGTSIDGLRWSRMTETGETVRAVAAGMREGSAAFGWVIDGTPDAALVLASRLVSEGFKVRVGEKPFVLGTRALPRGSFLLRVEDNPPGTADTLAARAAAAGVEVFPVASARIHDGPDLGGDHWPLVRPARIAVLAGPGLDFTSVGWSWHLLDREIGQRTSLLDVERVTSADLARYNVIVLPNSWERAAGYRRALGEEGLDELHKWVQAGGTLIGIAGGAELAADSGRWSRVRLRSQALKDFPGPTLGLDDGAVRSLERLQGMGLATDGSEARYAGPYEGMPAAAFGIPGPGAPVLGPGARALHGVATPAKAPSPPAAAAEDKLSEPEQERARERADERLKRFMPSGAVVRVDLDPEHWLAYGCGDRVAVMAQDGDALLARDPVTTVGRFAAPSQLQLGGLVWPEAAGRMAQTAWLTRESKGRGQVVLFATDPSFRGYFWGSQRPFLNAALLGPGLGAAHTIPW